MDKATKAALVSVITGLSPERLEELGGFEDDPPQCNAMFCIIDPHEGDQHCDATGHSWIEPTPSSPVIAHVYGEDGGRQLVYDDARHVTRNTLAMAEAEAKTAKTAKTAKDRSDRRNEKGPTMPIAGTKQQQVAAKTRHEQGKPHARGHCENCQGA